MAKIFLVDDDYDLVEQNKRVLTGKGHDVVFAYTAQKALEMLDNEKPDIMILDVMMESATAGLDLANKLGKLYPDLPLILLTGAEQKEQWMELDNNTWNPIVRFLDKPADSNLLLKTVDEVLKK